MDEESDTESVNEAVGQAVKVQEEPSWTDWQEVNSHPTTCLFCPFTTTKVTIPAIVYCKKKIASKHCFLKVVNQENVAINTIFYMC